MKPTKIFISHSLFDKEIADTLVDFLVRGIGINKKTIFCSSVPGHDIPIGVNFNDYIITQLQDYDAYVIAIISNNYYNSKYCLYELGAAWGLCKNKIIPFLVKGMRYGSLQDFISYSQAIDAESEIDINKLSDFFKNEENISTEAIPISKYEDERSELIAKCKPKDIVYKQQYSPLTKKAYPNFKYKVVVFDFDGTILQGEGFRHSWIAIWDYLHYQPSIRKELQKRHLKHHKEYTFQNWCDECVTHFINRGFKEQNIYDIIKELNLSIAEGFKITVKLLHDFGIRTVIISGGIDSFYYKTVPIATQNLIDALFINEFKYNGDGSLIGVKAFQNEDSDGVGKTKTLEKYCVENGFNLNEVVFVGDETNDIDIATHVGLSFAYPAQKATPHAHDLHLGNENLFRPIYNSNIASIISEILVVK